MPYVSPLPFLHADIHHPEWWPVYTKVTSKEFFLLILSLSKHAKAVPNESELFVGHWAETFSWDPHFVNMKCILTTDLFAREYNY